jgi:membrane-associated protein
MLNYLLTSFLVYQYWLFFAVTLVASIGFPLPATALILAGGAFFAEWYFDIGLLFLAGFCGCLLGDITGYTLARKYGKDIFARIGLKKILESDQFRTLEPYFLAHSRFSVFITRFLITGLGPSVNIFAGIARMRFSQFLLVDILGEVIYVALYLVIGYSFGSEWESIIEIIESFGTILVTLCLIGILFFLLKRYRKKARKAL